MGLLPTQRFADSTYGTYGSRGTNLLRATTPLLGLEGGGRVMFSGEPDVSDDFSAANGWPGVPKFEETFDSGYSDIYEDAAFAVNPDFEETFTGWPNDYEDAVFAVNPDFDETYEDTSWNVTERGTFFADMRAAMTNNYSTQTISDSAFDPSISVGGLQSFQGGVLMSSGKVLILPYKSTTARVYDPTTNTMSTPSGDAYPGSEGVQGGCLLLDGRVFSAPSRNCSSARVYDPATDTVSTPAAVFPITSSASKYTFQGCVRMNDGKVFLIPSDYGQGVMWNPVTDTISYANGTTFWTAGNTSNFGGCLLQDGRVLLGSWTHAACIYDPATNILSRIPSLGGSYTVGCPVVMADGRVYCHPIGPNTTAKIYDPSTNSVYNAGGTFPAGGDFPNWKFLGGALMTDGRIVLAPFSATKPYIYDPVTNTLSESSATTGGNFLGATIMKDGRALLVPDYDSSGRFKIYTGRQGTISDSYLISKFINKM